MPSDQDSSAPMPSEKGIIGRFAHLLSAQGVEGLGSALFFLYLAWLDSTLYGEVMYAIAAGAVVMKVVQFGLYYPLVAELGEADKDKASGIISRVNFIKLGLLVPAMAVLWAMTFYQGFSFRMAWVVLFVSLGFGLESLSETFFADFRVRGRQDKEARIKIASSALSYGYGFLAAFFGMDPLLVGLFKLISGVVRLVFGMFECLKARAGSVFTIPSLDAVWFMFRAASVFAMIEILGIVYNRANIFFLENAAGVKGVAFYSATYNLVDPVSVLASEQLLGWVIFPLLAALWWKKRDAVGSLVRRTAQWLMAIALPIMFILYTQSDLLIGFIYPPEYKDAIWMQQYLVWTILLSFESNLFCYLMMVSGAATTLLIFAVMATGLNLLFNATLVYPFGLAGACLVLILTKLVMTVLTFGYCQFKLGYFEKGDFLFPISAAVISVVFFLLIEPLVTLQPAVAATLGLYVLMIWTMGERFMGRAPGGRAASAEQ